MTLLNTKIVLFYGFTKRKSQKTEMLNLKKQK